jgi:curved DNA-binding protein CbpA
VNPYVVLEIPTSADDQTIRRAYLNAVKDSPPESDSKRFQEVSQAYEKIKDETSRYRFILFNQDCPGKSPLDTLVQYAARKRKIDPLPFEAMKEFLRAASQPAAK